MTVMILAQAHTQVSGATAAVGSVVAAGLSGLELAGTLGAISGSVVAIIALGLTVNASNRARRREFAVDLAAAEAKGEKDAREQLQPLLTRAEQDAAFWRQAYIDHADGRIPPAPGTEPHQ